MVLDDITSNLSELITSFPVEVSDRIFDLVLVLKTLGIIAIFYIFYVIIMGVLAYRRIKKMDHIEKKADAIDKKVNAISKKLDKLLSKKKKN